jgi:hypothetical protein
MVGEQDDRQLVNPYLNGSRRGFASRLAAVRRRMVVVIAAVVAVAVVGGSVAASCSPQVPQITGGPGG